MCLCLVAVFNIDVSWPEFVAEGNRGYEHCLSLIYLSALSFHDLPLSLAIYLALNTPPSLSAAAFTPTHKQTHTSKFCRWSGMFKFLCNMHSQVLLFPTEKSLGSRLSMLYYRQLCELKSPTLNVSLSAALSKVFLRSMKECGSAATQQQKYFQLVFVPSGRHFLRPQAAADYLTTIVCYKESLVFFIVQSAVFLTAGTHTQLMGSRTKQRLHIGRGLLLSIAIN